jgi:hypothetical protein
VGIDLPAAVPRSALSLCRRIAKDTNRNRLHFRLSPLKYREIAKQMKISIPSEARILGAQPKAKR